MNKEFKKLLEQSYTKGFEDCARTGHKVGDLDVIFNSIVMGEFGELIVRECAHLVGGYTKENEFGTDVKEAYEEITKHFGVE